MIDKNLSKNIAFLKERYGIGETFDIVEKEILIGKKEAYLLMINGFVNSLEMSLVIQHLQSLDIKKIDNLTNFIKKDMFHIEVQESDDFKFIEMMFLGGAIILFIDGEDKAIIVDARQFPIRGMEEPDLEKVTRGPRDGFVETLVFNTALVRRRVRDENLRFKVKTVGKRTKTNLAVAYITDLVDKDLLKDIEDKIDSIDLETLVMAEKTLSEQLIPAAWFNPLPKVRYTERPDVVASHLFEGHIVIMVDTSPSVIIVPTTVFHFTQHAEDYYQAPIVGTYVRQIRFFALLISLLLIPAWYLMSLYTSILPTWLQVISLNATDNFPVIAQLLILDFSVDLLKISAIHTPNPLGPSLGIVGGLILGNYAVEAGLFTGEAILITAITAIATFATPSIEFGHAMRIFRLFLLLLTAIFKLPGFIIGLLIILIMTFATKNGSRTSYIYPLIPFNFTHLKHILFRVPFPKTKKNK